MTIQRLTELVDLWKVRLGLGNWRIILTIGELEDETSLMEIRRSTDHDRARIFIPTWMIDDNEPLPDIIDVRASLTDEVIEVSLVHELLHLNTRDMRVVVGNDIETFLHRDVHTQVENAFRRAEEHMVDRLAVALVRAFSDGAT